MPRFNLQLFADGANGGPGEPKVIDISRGRGKEALEYLEAIDGSSAKQLVLRKEITFHEIKQVGDEDDRVLRFIGSSETEDRDRDILRASGWQLKNYRKNPVFMWAHRYWDPPVGKAIKVWIEEDKLIFDIKFPTAEEYAFADTIYRLYKGGYLNATSVGFIPLKWEARYEGEGQDRRFVGLEFTKMELLELSAVPVPSNPDALQIARSKGINVDVLAEMPPAKDDDGLVAKGADGQVDIGDTDNPDLDNKDTDSAHQSSPPDEPLEDSILLEDDSGRRHVIPEWAVELVFERFPEKAGAVLSRKNKERLQKISEMINEVLASAETQDDDDSDGKSQSNSADDAASLAASSITTEPFSLKAPNQLKPGVDTKAVAEYIVHAVASELKRLTGKVG